MINLASHKNLLEKNVVKDLKLPEGIELVAHSPSEEDKSAESESPQKKNVLPSLFLFG